MNQLLYDKRVRLIIILSVLSVLYGCTENSSVSTSNNTDELSSIDFSGNHSEKGKFVVNNTVGGKTDTGYKVTSKGMSYPSNWDFEPDKTYSFFDFPFSSNMNQYKSLLKEAYDNSDKWIKVSEVVGWTQVWYEVASTSYDYYYYGKIKNNKPEGKGVLLYGDSDRIPRYIGSFDDGIFNGYGMECLRGDFSRDGLVECNYKDGMTSGSGIQYSAIVDWNDKDDFLFSTYIRYEGNMTNNATPYKKGVLYDYDDSDYMIYKHYEGEFALLSAGHPEGKGKLYYPDGELLYDGKFKFGKIQEINNVRKNGSVHDSRWYTDKICTLNSEFFENIYAVVDEDYMLSGEAEEYHDSNYGDYSEEAFTDESVDDRLYENEDDYSDESYSEADSEYILPYSDYEYLDEEQLKELSKDELRIARNEIFARHGRKFNDSALMAYFESTSWYYPEYEPDEFDSQMENILNAVEKENLQMIKNEESRR